MHTEAMTFNKDTLIDQFYRKCADKDEQGKLEQVTMFNTNGRTFLTPLNTSLQLVIYH